MERVEKVFKMLTKRQHGVAAVWQLRAHGLRRTAIDHWLRTERPEQIRRGVYGDDGGLGRIVAAALALGPGAAVSHSNALAVWGLREHRPSPVHVSAPGRGGRARRDGIVVHRPKTLTLVVHDGIPVCSPTQALLDARLPRFARYRALEAAEALRLSVDRCRLTTPAWREVREVLRMGMNPTRSDAEARFIFLCRDLGIEMPVVNHQLNGVETDFHWPRARLVVEVDGWEFHRERPAFERDRSRGLTHRIAGWEVVRVSARQVAREPDAVAAGVLAAGPMLALQSRPRRAPGTQRRAV